MEFGWESILSIPVDIDADPQALHLLMTEYGKITMGQVNAHVDTYMDNEEQNAQNCFLLLIVCGQV